MSVLLTYTVKPGQGQKIIDNFDLFKFEMTKELTKESLYVYEFHSSSQHGELIIEIRQNKVYNVRLYVDGWGQDLLSSDDKTLIKAAEKVLEQQRGKDKIKRLYNEIETYPIHVELMPGGKIEHLHVFKVIINGQQGRIAWDNREQSNQYIIQGFMEGTKTLEEIRDEHKTIWYKIEKMIQSELNSKRHNTE